MKETIDLGSPRTADVRPVSPPWQHPGFKGQNGSANAVQSGRRAPDFPATCGFSGAGFPGWQAPQEERKTFRRAGVEIVYRVRRTQAASPEAPVVFLHGFASNMTRWTELVRETRLGTRHDLIRVDLRGHGESMTRSRYDLAIWIDDLAHLLDEECARGACLVGHSLGATLALGFALRRPDRVAALVLIDPVFRDAVAPDKARWVRNAALFGCQLESNPVGAFASRAAPVPPDRAGSTATLLAATFPVDTDANPRGPWNHVRSCQDEGLFHQTTWAVVEELV